ncbi:hypothetical protein HNY73_010588 [Argiope bruennichi]|uniref:Uncharacterized protein n=1 Tax=Argiope bruennichi TaxID=94029 RepID=A0A8T0F1G2_ARGBR|nr:hypothetical protein HNY73_010588 [Argiope bruennichi]
MDRYDKKKKIIHALIKTFMEQKGISQANSMNLRSIVDTSDEVLRGLGESLGEEASSRDPWLIHLLLQKLDPETRRLWSVKISEIEFQGRFVVRLPVYKDINQLGDRKGMTVSGLPAMKKKKN